MCDYSAEAVNQRQATVGDSLVLALLGAHQTKGFVGIDDPKTAVCMCQGTRIVLRITERMQRAWQLSGTVVPATFNQREPTGHNYYRDGVIFDELPGRHFSLQAFDLDAGATVEHIPGIAEEPPTGKTAAVEPEPAIA